MIGCLVHHLVIRYFILVTALQDAVHYRLITDARVRLQEQCNNTHIISAMKL